MKAFKSSHSSVLAGIIPRTEKPGRLQSMGLQRVVPDWTYKQNKKAKQSWEMAEPRSDPKCSYLKTSFSSLRIPVQPWISHSELPRHGQWSVWPWCSDLHTEEEPFSQLNTCLNQSPSSGPSFSITRQPSRNGDAQTPPGPGALEELRGRGPMTVFQQALRVTSF